MTALELSSAYSIVHKEQRLSNLGTTFENFKFKGKSYVKICVEIGFYKYILKGKGFSTKKHKAYGEFHFYDMSVKANFQWK